AGRRAGRRSARSTARWTARWTARRDGSWWLLVSGFLRGLLSLVIIVRAAGHECQEQCSRMLSPLLLSADQPSYWGHGQRDPGGNGRGGEPPPPGPGASRGGAARRDQGGGPPAPVRGR